MDLQELQSILTETNGSRVCPICGTPFKPYHSRQKSCGAPECKREIHNQYMRERTKRLRSENIYEWRKYHRDAQRKSREKKRKRIERDNQLRELGDKWQERSDFEKLVQEDGLRYGEVQKQKTLEKVPKINLELGEPK